MDQQDNVLKRLDVEYGVSISPIEFIETDNNYKKISNDDFAKINSAFQYVPSLLKSMYEANHYSDAYKVVYNKGLGVLQKSAKDPNLFRANVVTPGTNNEITGQALLKELNPSFITLSNIVLSTFTIASIATNQYFLARIDKKLESIEKKVNEIHRFLETEKENELISHGDFLYKLRDKLPYILHNETYTQSTLTNVQKIRTKSRAHFKSYYDQIKNIKSSFNQNDNFKETTEKLNKLRNYLPKYWYSAYLYEVAYCLEVYFSQMTDSAFLQKVRLDMEEIVKMYQDGYDLIRHSINEYIDEVKAFKPTEIPTFFMKGAGKLISKLSVGRPVIRLGLRGIGLLLDKGADQLYINKKMKKETMKEELIYELESEIQPYADLKPLQFQTDAIKQLDYAYNKHLELIITNNDAYLKID